MQYLVIKLSSDSTTVYNLKILKSYFDDIIAQLYKSGEPKTTRLLNIIVHNTWRTLRPSKAHLIPPTGFVYS